MNECIYVNKRYHKRIFEILDDTTIPIYIREHMSESPNWLQNNDIKQQVDTFVWLSYNDSQKKNILDEELNTLQNNK